MRLFPQPLFSRLFQLLGYDAGHEVELVPRVQVNPR